MILKALMEEKQLDFNQPLLSVRRFSSTAASENDSKRTTDKSSAKLPPLPYYKSELKSGPVSNPGTVPFVWERTPGRPKNKGKSQTQAIERPSLPPGRVLKAEQQDSDKVPKGTYTSINQSKLGSTVSESCSAVSLDDKVQKHESQKEAIQEKSSSGSDDGDEAYLDALDTLSRTESFFMNCSVSNLSQWDDQEVQPSGSFSTDQQARDFMIGRFLPAAKAMASETPQIRYTSRKPPVMQEQPRHIRKVVSEAKSRPLNQKWQKMLPHYAQDNGREESEDESDDDDRYENYAPKVCGLFPRFCLLNPVPGLRMEDRILSSAVHGVQGKSIASHRRTSKEHARTTNYEKKSGNSQSGFTKEKDSLGIPEKFNHDIDPHRRGFSKSSACESTQSESSCESPIEKTLYVDSVHKVTSSEVKGSTKYIEDDFDSSRKDNSIDKIPFIDSSIEDSKHLDDEQAALQTKSSASLDSSLLVCSDISSDDVHMEMKNHYEKIYSEKQALTKTGYHGSRVDNNLAVIPSTETIECKKIESESKVSSSKNGSDDPIQNPVSLRNLKLGSDLKFDSKSQQAIKLVGQEGNHGSNEYPSTLTNSNVVDDVKIGLKRQSLTKKLGHRKTSDASSLKLPLALPSPKAPSESWLKRTLPTVSSRNISSRSNLAPNFHAPTQPPKTASLDPKWEMVVKSSNVHLGHPRFSEELLPSIPEA